MYVDVDLLQRWEHAYFVRGYRLIVPVDVVYCLSECMFIILVDLRLVCHGVSRCCVTLTVLSSEFIY